MDQKAGFLEAAWVVCGMFFYSIYREFNKESSIKAESYGTFFLTHQLPGFDQSNPPVALSCFVPISPITLSLGIAAQKFRATRSPIRVSILWPSFWHFTCLMRAWITCLFRQPGQGDSLGQGKDSRTASLYKDPLSSTWDRTSPKY